MKRAVSASSFRNSVAASSSSRFGEGGVALDAPDHRVFETSGHHQFMTCCSRSKSTMLVLDL
jgi:hypothetical protein